MTAPTNQDIRLPAEFSDEAIERAFDEFAAGFDCCGDEWQDMGANEYFAAGFKAALAALDAKGSP